MVGVEAGELTTDRNAEGKHVAFGPPKKNS
jgi:hypothetical protein